MNEPRLSPEEMAPEESWDPSEAGDLLDAIVAEGGENLDALSQGLLTLERDAGNKKAMDACFRKAHNLKGLAVVIGLRKWVELARGMEDLLDAARGGERTLVPEDFDILLRMIDALRQGILPAIEARRAVDIDLSGLWRDCLARIEGIAPPETMEAPLPPPEKTPPASPAPEETRTAAAEAGPKAAAASAPTLRVAIDRLDSVLNLVGELVIARIRFDRRVLDLLSLGPELERSGKELNVRSRGDHASRILKDLTDGIERCLWTARLEGREDPIDRLEEHLRRLVADARAGLSENTDLSGIAHASEEIDRVRRVFDDLTADLVEATDTIGRLASGLQEGVMKVRMVPVEQVFAKFPRVVRDLSRRVGKPVFLELKGEDTEIDKLLGDAVADPLLHLVRNAVDHGIEDPETRGAAGKPPEGQVVLSAYHEGSQVVLEVSDDGGGIRAENLRRLIVERRLASEEVVSTLSREDVLDYLFRPGFSTARQVSDISGRGVGLDVVRDAIAGLKGSVEVVSEEGRGTTFRIRLPLTLAVIRVLRVSRAGEAFAIPLDAVREMVHVAPEEVYRVGEREVMSLRGKTLPLYRLEDLLDLRASQYDPPDLHPVVVLGAGERRVGIVVDRFEGKEEVVAKTLGTFLRRVPMTLGSTILGDGRVLLILDPQALLDGGERSAAGSRASAASVEGEPAPAGGEILLVDDSPVMRERARKIMEAAGFRVTEAVDGIDALAKARQRRFDLVSTDVAMPRMDGHDLTRSLRALAGYEETPIIMVTSRGEKMDRVRGFDAGADAYLTKPFDAETLVRTIREHLL